MRYYLAFLFLFFLNPSTAQYIDGIATDDIDSLHIDVRNEFAAMNFAVSINTSKQFMDYWAKRKSASPKDQDIASNYLYSFIEHYKSKRRVNQLNEDTVQDYFKIKSDIENVLGEDHLVLANYYTFAGELYHVIVGDRQAAVDVLEEGLKIRRKHEPEQYKAQANDLISLGYSYNRLNMMDSSLYHLQEALVLAKQVVPKATLMIMRNMYAIATTYYTHREYDQALETFIEAYEMGEENNVPTDHDVNVVLIKNIGVVSEITGDMDIALKYAVKSLELAKLRPENNKEVRHTHYESISRIRLLRGELFEANKYLDSAFLVMNQNNVKKGLSSLMLQKAALATSIEEELYYNEQSYKYCEQEPDCDGKNYHLMLTNIAKIHEKKGDYQSALNLALQSRILQESDKRRNDQNLPETYSLLASLYSRSGQNEQAIEYGRSAIEAQRNLSTSTSFKEAIYESQLARYQLDNDKAATAESIYKNSLTTLRDNIGLENLSAIQVINSLSDLYLKEEKYDSSLHYAQLSYKALSKNFDESHPYYVEPYINSIRSYQERGDKDSSLLYIERVLSICGFKEFDSNKVNNYDIPDHRLWKSFESYFEIVQIQEELDKGSTNFTLGKIKTGLSLIDRLRTLYFFETSEKDFQKRIRAFLNWSLRQLSIDYEIHNDPEVLQLIFECMEKSKSIMINRNFARTQSISNRDIPEEIIDEEKSILMEYQYYFEKYEKEKFDLNDSIENEYVNRMFDLEEQKQDLLDHLKGEYLDYYKERYTQRVTRLDEIQKYATDNDLGFLIYHWGDDHILSLLINQDEIKFIRNPIGDLEQLIAEFKSEFEPDTELESGFKRKINKFITLSSILYDKILGNHIDSELPFNIAIIPDGPLVNLPFGILLEGDVGEDTSFKDLPYVIKKHAISYMGSASQVLVDYNRKAKEKQYIGFAPQYEGEESEVMTSADFVGRNIVLDPLIYNSEEIEKSAQLFDGEIVLGERATVSRFRSLASSYDYLHLAMHAKVSNDFPLESHLNFAVEDSLGTDGNLEVREIAKMQLDNQLVVLSACETNVGESVLGEGVLGIARAFNLASCHNLVMSSWVVDDKSSSEILVSFFQNLKNDMNPATSLRNAKLEYLNNSSMINAHPSYWASFNYFGSPLRQKGFSFPNGFNALMIFGLAVLGLFCSLLVWRKVSNPSNS